MSSTAHRRPTTILGLLTAAVLLTGCSGLGISNTETVTVTEAAPADASTAPENSDPTIDTAPENEGSQAAPATFDRNDPNFEFFNICEELTNEDLAEFGVEFTGGQLIELDSPSSVCSFRDKGGFSEHKGNQYADVVMNGLTEEELLSQVIEIQTGVADKATYPEMVFIIMGESERNEACGISAPTERGRLWVSYGTLRSGVMTQDEICEQTLEYFDHFYQEVEKHS